MYDWSKINFSIGFLFIPRRWEINQHCYIQRMITSNGQPENCSFVYSHHTTRMDYLYWDAQQRWVPCMPKALKLFWDHPEPKAKILSQREVSPGFLFIANMFYRCLFRLCKEYILFSIIKGYSFVSLYIIITIIMWKVTKTT